MRTLVFLLEEPSAREMLKGVLPRLLPEDIHVDYIVFRGKQDLEKNLEFKLRYWQKPNTAFIVLRDQDAGDCRSIKQFMVVRCINSGREDFLVRIACRELESFYLGDLAAVEAGLSCSGLARLQKKSKYRDPDMQVRHPDEELRRLSRNLYDKMSGSRAIGPHLGLQDNCSTSFRHLVSGIQRLLSA